MRAVVASVDPIEQQWRALAAAALDAPDPLWVVLGDSTAQGIGATSLEHTWVARVGRRLDEADRGHGIVNLSRSGALIADVIADQLPMLAMLEREPTVVTCCVGANDLSRALPTTVATRVERLAAALPSGTFIATVPSPRQSPSGRIVNRAIREHAAANDHTVADLQPHLLGAWRGTAADHFHPGDDGYGAWVAAFCAVLGLDS